MNEIEVEKVLLDIEDVSVSSNVYARPSRSDWDRFRERFGTDFGETFVSFTNLMSKFLFTGETFKISDDSINLNESIYSVYEHESSYKEWNSGMLPIIGYGNGDYLCFDISKGSNTCVYSYQHEDASFIRIADSFDQWLISTDGY